MEALLFSGSDPTYSADVLQASDEKAGAVRAKRSWFPSRVVVGFTVVAFAGAAPTLVPTDAGLSEVRYSASTAREGAHGSMALYTEDEIRQAEDRIDIAESLAALNDPYEVPWESLRDE